MKKILSTLLAVLVMMLPLTLAASAADGVRGSVREYVTGPGSGSLEENYSLGQSGDPHDMVVYPGDIIYIPLTTDLFEWSNGRRCPPQEAFRDIWQLWNSKVRLSRRTLAGIDVLEYAKLEYGTVKNGAFFNFGTTETSTRKTVYIKVKFADDYQGVDDVEFRYRIYLTVNGSRYEELSMMLRGDYKQVVDHVDAGFTDFNMEQGEIIEADETVPRISLDIGSGVVVDKHLNKGMRYYGQAYYNDSVEDMREEWTELYPDVVGIYRIRHKNLDTPISQVTLTPTDGKQYYVYNGDMEFTGMTGSKMPFSDIYFLSTTEIPSFELDSYLDSLPNQPVAPQF